MSNFINGYILRNSLVHRLHPVLKILMFACFVVLVFLPLGLVIQSVIWLLVSIIFFVAKIPSRIYFSNVKSIIFMFLILLFINWFTYRNPGFIELNTLRTSFNQIGTYEDNAIAIILDQNNFFNNSVHPSGFWANLDISLNGQAQNNINSYEDFLKLLPNQKLPDNYILSIGRYWGSEIVGFDIKTGTNNDLFSIVPIMKFQGYAFSTRTLVMTVFITQKIYIMILLAVILTSTSTSIELSYAIEQILSPLKIFKLPVNSLAMTISIAIRFVPSLLLESQRILNAQASRGIDFKNGSVLERGHALVSLIVPMVSIAFRNAGEISSAMEARAYNPRFARTRYRSFSIHASDWITYFALMLFLGFGIFIAAMHVFIAPFGAVDWMTQGFANNVAVQR